MPDRLIALNDGSQQEAERISRMCKEATNCELRERVNELGEEMENVKARLSTVEENMCSMRAETIEGFRASREDMKNINYAIGNLAHDFGERMTVLERMTAEKEKWGECMRWTVKVIVRVICALSLAAGGITVCRLFFAN